MEPNIRTPLHFAAGDAPFQQSSALAAILAALAAVV
jgi:hypothetical protein